MKRIAILFLLLCLTQFGYAKDLVRVALVTGPHGYEKESFIPMMNSLKGISWKEYVNPEAQELFTPERSEEYDVLVFYDMCPDISDERKQQLMDLVSGGKPVLVLHHGMGTYNNWPEFACIAGSKYLLSPQTIEGKEYGYSSYREGVDIPLKVKKNHYITRGIKDFSINDEVYGNMWQGNGINVLVSTEHPECSPAVLYTHHYGKGKIVGLTLAHGAGAFSSKPYVTLFNRALQWLADETLQDPVVLAYVTSWGKSIPDPESVTHINYAFGHVTNSFDGIRIDNEDRLRMIVSLKKQKPSLQVLLSVGGWGSGRFSEMAANKTFRKSFAADCKRVIDEFGLDGIDIDWEFPTSSAAGISSSPDDTKNYTLLMQDIRQAIGNAKWLTLASQAGAGYIDFKAIDKYVDFVNIMTYDMASSPQHHAGLYRSSMTGWLSCDEAVDAHLKAGIPIHRLVFGIPFYGHGCREIPNFIDYNKIIELKGYTEKWDNKAKVPYLVNSGGEVVCNFENKRSVKLKCQYVSDKKMRGAMYWDYDGDDQEGTLRYSVYEGIMSSVRK